MAAAQNKSLEQDLIPDPAHESSVCYHRASTYCDILMFRECVVSLQIAVYERDQVKTV
jgi:hypothetical protein